MATLSPGEAADALDSTPNLVQLRVKVLHPGYAGHDAPHVSRFVAALHNHRKVRVVSFVGCSFVASWGKSVNERSARAQEFEHLFGSVLPRHASLHNVSFSISVIPALYLRMMMMVPADPPAAPSSSLRQLSLYDCPIVPHGEAAQAIADALGSLGNAGSHLTDVRVARCHLSSDDCHLLLDGASGSRTLVSLSIDEPDTLVVEARTLELLMRSNGSSLRTIRVAANKWTNRGIAAVAQIMRTNVHLESLDVSGTRSGELRRQLCNDVLRTYNFSLRYVPGADPDQQVEMNRLLDRNVRVRQGYDRLKEDGIPRVGLGVLLWAEAFQRVGPFPTLRYRLLRKSGHSVALAEAYVQAHPTHSRRRKRKLAPSAAKADDDPRPVRRSRRRRN